MVTATEIAHWFTHAPDVTTEGKAGVSIEALTWVLSHWASLANEKTRALSPESVKDINRIIKTVPTGKQRRYQQAVKQICAYLYYALGWQLPERNLTAFKDEENRKLAAILSTADAADALFTVHETVLGKLLDAREPIPVGAVILEILFSLAPLNIASLCAVINGDGEVEHHRMASYCLNIDNHNDHYLRFLLPPRTEQTLRRCSQAKYTEKQIQSALCDYLMQAPFYYKKSACQFRTIRQLALCHWAQKTSPFTLRDMMYPERQFALPPRRFAACQRLPSVAAPADLKLLYAVPAFDEVKRQRLKSTTPWPHRSLKKSQLGASSFEIYHDLTRWPQDDVVPHLLWCYTAELLQFGGAKREKLANSTIQTYTHIEQHLTALPRAVCFDEQALNEWVADNLARAPSSVIKEHLQRFFRFAAHHPMTEMLDTTLLCSPHEPARVDVNTVTPAEFDVLLATLDAKKPDCFSQWVFSRLAASLAFHGMLRRGEILRLRRRDICPAPQHQHVYRLTICSTPEGQTKNRRRRIVYLALPIRESLLLQWLLDAKAGSDWKNAPLLSLAGETLSERAAHYLLPVTKALCAVCGNESRFHHLRHGGITLFFRQCLSFSLNRYLPETAFLCVYEQAVYSEKFIKARLSFWLNDHPNGINLDRMLDVFTTMIGHSDFATTRRHYLHGHEWLALHHWPATLSITKTAVRHGLGLFPRASDLPRQLTRLAAITDNTKTVTLDTPRWLAANIAYYTPPPSGASLSHESIKAQILRFETTPLRDKRNLWQTALHTACAPRWQRNDSLARPNALPFTPWCKTFYREPALSTPHTKQLIRWLEQSEESRQLLALSMTSRDKQRLAALTGTKTFRGLKPELVILPPIRALEKQKTALKGQTGLPPRVLSVRLTAPGIYLRFCLSRHHFTLFRNLILSRGEYAK